MAKKSSSSLKLQIKTTDGTQFPWQYGGGPSRFPAGITLIEVLKP